MTAMTCDVSHEGHVRTNPHSRRKRLAALAVAAVLGFAVAAAPSLPSVALPADPQPVLTLPIVDGQMVALAEIPKKRWLAGHRGIDVEAPVGESVVAPGAGTVAFAGMVAGRPVMTVRLDLGLNATFEPVSTSLRAGDRVSRGELIGWIADASNHCGASSCLHWGLKTGETYHNPLDWLEGFGPVGLLPVDASVR